ncbi:hypothetical protein ONZ45_g7774 [Pleurotus djamor]|nr:hypothetical protein ONZ45_g7774 [Pleurotus djamor]
MPHGTTLYITSSYEEYIPIPKHLRFSPPDGKSYKDEDRETLCKMTPIPIWNIHRYLLGSSQVEHHLPPLFYCCWAIGRQALIEMTLKEFPDNVRRTKRVGGRVISSTAFSMAKGVVKRFDVPADLRDRIRVTGILLPNNTVDLALCIGDNVDGIVRPHEIINEIANTLFNGEMPQWHLSPLCWQWHRKSCWLSPEESEEWMRVHEANANLRPDVSPAQS